MKPAQAIAATLGIGAICVTLTACDLADIGDAQTAAELAPSLEALREAVPEHHRRLADGTFDSLSILEQWDFVAEVRNTLRKRRYLEAGLSEPSDEAKQPEGEEAESERASRESTAMLLEVTKAMSGWPFDSRFLLQELKREDSLEQATKSPIGWLLTWYLWKTDEPVRIQMQPVVGVGKGACGSRLFAFSRGSQGFEAVEVPVIAEDCP